MNDSFLVDSYTLDEGDDPKLKECMICENNSCDLSKGVNCLDVSKLTPKLFVESTSHVEKFLKIEENFL